MSSKKSPMMTIRNQRSSYSTEIHSYYFKSSINETAPEFNEGFPEVKQFNDLLNYNPSLRRLYTLVIDNIHLQSYKDAIFFCDKLLTLTDDHPIVVYLLGECYFNNSDYKKVHSLFVKYKILNYNQNFQILAARSLVILPKFHFINSYKPLFRSKISNTKFA